MESTNPSLQGFFAKSLPKGFQCRYNYIRSPSRPCEALFSSPSGHEDEKTKLASHFLGVSLFGSDRSVSDKEKSFTPGPTVFVLALEVLVFSTKHLTTIFVSKADSTGYSSDAGRVPVKRIVSCFLQWLSDKERVKHRKRKLVISLFARSQSQYLFPGSIEHEGKHVLDDRQLIKWWGQVLEPLLVEADARRVVNDQYPDYQGYMTVPGCDATDLRLYHSRVVSSVTGRPHWRAGDPLVELALARGLPTDVPTRCLLPRFPDDPKARYMLDLDEEVGIVDSSSQLQNAAKRRPGRWMSINDLTRFWEAMQFRQECSSGRAVGFLWLVIAPINFNSNGALPGIDQDKSQPSTIAAVEPPPPSKARPAKAKPHDSLKKNRRKPLTGPIISRPPRFKGSASSTSSPKGLVSKNSIDGIVVTGDGYDAAMQALLHLDFANRAVAEDSTRKWIEEVAGLCGLAREQWGVLVEGTQVQIANGVLGDGDNSGLNNVDQVNQLDDMLKKKRGLVDAAGPEGVVDHQSPAVNVLSAGAIRKKPKPATSS